jgi:transcriptional regulator with XRE-family HTH domain
MKCKIPTERDAIMLLVARNLEKSMARKGTTAAEVARKAGLNPTGVYDILSGKSRNPRLDTLYKIATLGLGVPFASMFIEPGDEAPARELMDAVCLLSPADQHRFLVMARAVLDDASNT